jgi:hypothetical protein
MQRKKFERRVARPPPHRLAFWSNSGELKTQIHTACRGRAQTGRQTSNGCISDRVPEDPSNLVDSIMGHGGS